MNESILNTVKKTLGIDESIDDFDIDLVLHINSVLASLIQIGIGPTNGFVIAGPTETWSDFLGDDKRIEMVKTYVAIKVRMIFDPPSNSTLLKALESACSEFETRAYFIEEVDNG